ncbi:signal peptidase I, bacterial type [Chloracidobacterium thermophilum B]|jgi:signal peptidase I|uniref:Signal peptidase I n=1 Tax=Chloracidobacterium thermophilum (strain B) TaxID=981222 RepID=G2LI73_CHLTF|nr:signal peptidase I, bacterial type [Chloracidobacterium thermophilum B]
MMMHDDFHNDQFSNHRLPEYPFSDYRAAEASSGMRAADSPWNETAPISSFGSEVEAAVNSEATTSAAALDTGQLPQPETALPDAVATETCSEPLAQAPETPLAQDGGEGTEQETATPCLTSEAIAASQADTWSQPVFRPLWTVDSQGSSSGSGLGDEAGVVISTFTGPPPAWKHWVREGLSIGRDVLLALVIALLIGLFVIQPVYVKGTSMLPRLREGERLFVNRFIYNFSKIERGDIVVFYYPKNPQESFIKRVIGLPGDEVTLANGKLYINGKLVPEGYLSSDYTTIVSPPRTWVVEPHHYFVMGDNRDASNDSRNWGLVPEMYIYGKAVYRYWPVSEMGFIEDEPTLLEPLRRLQRMEDRMELPPAE